MFMMLFKLSSCRKIESIAYSLKLGALGPAALCSLKLGALGPAAFVLIKVGGLRPGSLVLIKVGGFRPGSLCAQTTLGALSPAALCSHVEEPNYAHLCC
jgi:hypothetical protein